MLSRKSAIPVIDGLTRIFQIFLHLLPSNELPIWYRPNLLVNFKKIIRSPAHNIARSNTVARLLMKAVGYSTAPHEVRLRRSKPASQAGFVRRCSVARALHARAGTELPVGPGDQGNFFILIIRGCFRTVWRSALFLAGIYAISACAFVPSGPASLSTDHANNPLLVAAASDLILAFPEIGQQFEQETGQVVTFSFGSSGNLTSQIENGAPFDLFAAANVAYLERLREKGLIIPDTLQPYARGRLVLALYREAGITATRLEDLLNPSIEQVAIANPAHAPYGLAAQQALQRAGIWDILQPKLVYGENVRQALQFVQTGQVPVALVALSIANIPEVTYTLVDESLHDPIIQALGVVRNTPREALAREFVAFVIGPAGKAILQKYGFQPPGEN